MRSFGTCIAISVLIAVTAGSTPSAEAQTFTVIHNFTGNRDGANPIAGLTIGGLGTLYGTTSGGGLGGGVVFMMTHSAGGWILKPIYEFAGGSDGSVPWAGVAIGPNGALYGTTQLGGSAGRGTVFEIAPPPTICSRVLCYWNETVLHDFMGGSDGSSPAFGNLTFDHAGNIYGTTQYGGGTGCSDGQGCGVVFKLATSSGGQWTESIVHSFGSGNDGQYPLGGMIFDTAGNLYGTTSGGGSGAGGTVFQLTPFTGTWLENILFDFDTGTGCDNDTGCAPAGTLIIDQFGSLYGTGQGGSGTAFELTPSNGSWNFSVLSFFCCQPVAGLTMDAAGNLYGTTISGGNNGYGMLFKLTNSSGMWRFTDVHDFTGGSDGGVPYGAVVLAASGNLFGTAYEGGAYGYGVVWEMTP